jgi:hypothetical protein
MKLVWFKRPGVASTFTPNLGTAQEWSTSAAVTRIRVWALTGRTVWLSTSKRRGDPLSISKEGIM